MPHDDAHLTHANIELSPDGILTVIDTAEVFGTIVDTDMPKPEAMQLGLRIVQCWKRCHSIPTPDLIAANGMLDVGIPLGTAADTARRLIAHMRANPGQQLCEMPQDLFARIMIAATE